MSTHHVQPLPGITLNGASYPLDEVVFESIPRTDRRYIRRREVQAFRVAPQPPQRPRWNASVVDETRPFPERPLMHTLHCYNGVGNHCGIGFPAVISGAEHLGRSPPTLLWRINAEKAASHTSAIARSCTPLSNKSFLARIIAEDLASEGKTLRDGWLPPSLTGTIPHYKWDQYRSLHDTWGYHNIKPLRNIEVYVTPYERVKLVNQKNREEKYRKRMEKAGAVTTFLPSIDQQHVPESFKMSNIDEWWHLDPTLPLRRPPEGDVVENGASRI
ncbi:hypothetical protein ERJ75_000014300 [Trypanosoma vivax]|uniref:Uncharacterized protein n=1 Tax=Trypanosoma vivax (strain Y486) TaxID=1055687 RepID=G0TU47_TRYVY|nr:hypothetical protein TRVL_00151 [Trypanosoma vivax]KAH8613740.1 hypothetical protein ERJ75_000704300 [Trypanosoma vivax]KAH8620910.1 hypothetical protein ERJ75_000014300 [Trypanosoma vivax]CCC47481.1 conserved hypothetical protein [Trypanosoma vivax Y486]